MQHELLAPVGHRDMAWAAIHNGADAIYLGFPGFNARGRTHDFTRDELQEIIETCHLYGVKVHIALNIVFFENEILSLLKGLSEVFSLKPDSFIVQDLGVANLLREMFPSQVLHASTQVTVTNYEAIELLSDINFKRFVLGRENSIEEIKLIREKSQKDLEVFVHGALCVAYSGQCYTSESLGGRSANRGQCAQSCRFSYELRVDGQKKEMGNRKYLVSPQDLCGIQQIPELIEAGVNSFKVEGRLKSVDYVAITAREYRSAIDRHLQGVDFTPSEVAQSQHKMAITYSRGFYKGWLHGVQHQELIDGTFSAHRGALIGSIHKILGHEMRIILNQNQELFPGDGVLWSYMYQNKEQEEGAQIYEVLRLRPLEYALRFSNEVRLNPHSIGGKLYLNHSSSLSQQVQKSFTDRSVLKRIFVEIEVHLQLGQRPLYVMNDNKNKVQVWGASEVVQAEKKEVTDHFIKEEMSSLGGTVFQAKKVQVFRTSKEPLFISHREIKEARRELSQKLTELRKNNRVESISEEHKSVSEMSDWVARREHRSPPSMPRLRVLLRNREQVEDLCQAIDDGQLESSQISSLTLDFEFGRNFAPSLERARQSGLSVGIATTRILKPQEYRNLKAIESLQPDHILIRNLGALQYYSRNSNFKGQIHGDFSLNVTNHLTADYLFKKGLSSLCASYDLNQQQVEDLLRCADASRFEITVHQYMPSFHMEHCVFAAFLSEGSSYLDCGKPCERHEVELKDQFGNVHFIKADQECRNTMFNGVPYSAARYIEGWKKLGLGFVRYEALNEKGDELIQKVSGYGNLLCGKKSAEQIVSELRLLERYGLGLGSLARSSEYQSRKSN